MAEQGKMKADDIALALLTIAEVPNFYSGLLPSLWTIGHFSNTENEEAKHWIRRGEMFATAFSLALGTAASLLSHSIIPIIGASLMAGLLLYLYEHALSTGSNSDYSNQN